MKLDKKKSIEALIECFLLFQDQGWELVIEWYIKEMKYKKTFTKIENMEMDENFNLILKCLSVNGEIVVFTFTNKSNEKQKISRLSIWIFMDGQRVIEYP